MEEWKEIKDSKGVYFISSKGRLKTLNWKNTGREAFFKFAKDKKGYLRTALIINGKIKTIKVHRLVAEYFIHNPKKKPQVNHKNCNKEDNNVSNLEWVTSKENFYHSVKHNKQNKFLENIGKTSNLKPQIGENNKTSKLTEIEVLEIRRKFIPRKYTRKMLAKEYNVKESTIKDVVLRKSWRWLSE